MLLNFNRKKICLIHTVFYEKFPYFGLAISIHHQIQQFLLQLYRHDKTISRKIITD